MCPDPTRFWVAGHPNINNAPYPSETIDSYKRELPEGYHMLIASRHCFDIHQASALGCDV